MNNGQKVWFAIDICIAANATQSIEFAFNELGSLGTEIDGLRKAAGEPLWVTGYFEVLPDDAEVRLAVGESLRIHSISSDAIKSIESRRVEETDWLAEWKKHWKPTEVGKFVIAPPWESVDETDKIVIRIEPNMAFGTGTHETTQLCLKAIGERYDANQTFLDVGTGTGILAIAAAKTQGKRQNLKVKILACDTDADSVKIAGENAIANGVADLIEFFHGSIDDTTHVFDFVCANLTIDVIMPILGLLLAKTSSVLLLSGILTEQEACIVEALQEFQISDFKFEMAGEWLSVMIRVN